MQLPYDHDHNGPFNDEHNLIYHDLWNHWLSFFIYLYYCFRYLFRKEVVV